MREGIYREQQIEEIIKQAQKCKGSFEEKSKILEKAIQKAKEDAISGGSMVSNSGQLSGENLYNYKLAGLYYDIQSYDKSLEINQELYKKIKDGCFAKSVGDCLRHMNKFEDALKYYQEGLKLCKQNRLTQLKHAILNSEGLTYVSKREYDTAIKKYKEAIKMAPKNPLYHCNLAGAYLINGKRQDANIQYSTAASILDKFTKGDEENEGISREHINFIKKQLKDFLPLLKQLQQFIKKQAETKGRKLFLERINGIGSLFNQSLTNHTINMKEQGESIKQNFVTLKELEKKGNENLYLFYDGMQHKLAICCAAAMTIESDVAILNTGTMPIQIAKKLVTFLPIIGDILSSGIEFVGNFITKAQLKKRANYMSKMASDPTAFNLLTQDVILRVISKNKGLINEMVPSLQKSLLPKWLNGFKKFAQTVKMTKKKIQKELYGDRYQHPMQQYGHNVGTQLYNYISSGQFYKKQDGPVIQTSVKRDRLIARAEEILKKDFKSKDETINNEIPQELQKLSNQDNNDGQENSKTCIIGSLNQIFFKGSSEADKKKQQKKRFSCCSLCECSIY